MSLQESGVKDATIIIDNMDVRQHDCPQMVLCHPELAQNT